MSGKETTMNVREKQVSNVTISDIREKRKRTSKKISQMYVSGQLRSQYRGYSML